MFWLDSIPFVSLSLIFLVFFRLESSSSPSHSDFIKTHHIGQSKLSIIFCFSVLSPQNPYFYISNVFGEKPYVRVSENTRILCVCKSVYFTRMVSLIDCFSWKKTEYSVFFLRSKIGIIYIYIFSDFAFSAMSYQQPGYNPQYGNPYGNQGAPPPGWAPPPGQNQGKSGKKHFCFQENRLSIFFWKIKKTFIKNIYFPHTLQHIVNLMTESAIKLLTKGDNISSWIYSDLFFNGKILIFL